VSSALRTTAAGAIATLLASLALLPAMHSQAWLWPTALAVGFVATTGFGLRQLGTPRVLIPLGQLAALGWAATLVWANEELRFGFLPSSESVRTLVERVNDGLLVVVRFAAPVPYDPDLVIVTALGVGLVAIAVDTMVATFRLAPWAGLPLLLLYSIPATTVTDGISPFAFVLPAIGYITLLVSEGRERLNRWGRVVGFADDVAGPQESVGASALGQTGRRIGATVIGLAVIIPAVLPALPEGVFGQGEGTGFGNGGGQTIRVDNPIVDLKRDLRLPQNVPILRYRTEVNQPDYIKLVTLDEFDGQRWRPSQRSVRDIAGGSGENTLPEPPGLDDRVRRTRVRSTFEIAEALESKWLPTPYPPSTLDVPGDWGYDPDTLDIVSKGESSSGLRYDVTTLDIDLHPEGLQAAGPAPSAIHGDYTKLPAGLPRQVVALARQQTAGAATAYEKAVALQRWFRTDFVYDLTVQPGHGGSAMVEFLTDKRGYCEQFAATMAVMARSLGIPARVAVGYLPGTRQPDNSWLVTAHDSHAWPELYFAGYGWVRFEPTPQAQTGMPPTWTVPDSGTTFTPGPDQTANPEDPRQDRASAAPAVPTVEPTDMTAPVSPGSGRWSINPVPLFIGVGVLLILASPMLVRTTIRRLRLARQEPAHLVEGAWRELADACVDYGMPWDTSLTPRAAGSRLLSALPTSAAPAVHRLVGTVERTRYAPEPGSVGSTPRDVRMLIRALREGAPFGRQALALLLPPSLWLQLPRLWQPVTRLFDALDALGPRLRRWWSRPGAGSPTATPPGR
jgi:transglutaminase-like putative cysteine protease